MQEPVAHYPMCSTMSEMPYETLQLAPIELRTNPAA